MLNLLNSHRFGGGGGEVIVVPVYGVAGAPDPLLANNAISGVYTSSTDAGGATGYAALYKDGCTAAGASIANGAFLVHDDPTMLLHGYWVATYNDRGSVTMEYALYKCPTVGAINGTSNIATLVPASKVQATFAQTGQKAWGRYIPLPAPIALDPGNYVLARSSPIDSGGGHDLKFKSYATAASLPPAGAYADQGKTVLPATWGASTDIATAGPYWEKTVMAPANPKPMVAVDWDYLDMATTLPGGSGLTSYDIPFTVGADVGAGKTLFITLSSSAANARQFTSMKINGIEGMQYSVKPSTNAAGAVGFWKGGQGIVAGANTLTVTIDSSSPSNLRIGLAAFGCSNASQFETQHHYSHTAGNGGNAFYSCPGTTRYYDAFLASCKGGTTSPADITATGIWAAHGEFAATATDLGDTVQVPIKYLGLIPTTAASWGLYYGLGNTSAPHCMPFVLVARA